MTIWLFFFFPKEFFIAEEVAQNGRTIQKNPNLCLSLADGSIRKHKMNSDEETWATSKSTDCCGFD